MGDDYKYTLGWQCSGCRNIQIGEEAGEERREPVERQSGECGCGSPYDLIYMAEGWDILAGVDDDAGEFVNDKWLNEMLFERKYNILNV